MKSKSKIMQITALVLAVFMSMSFFVACGGGNSHLEDRIYQLEQEANERDKQIAELERQLVALQNQVAGLQGQVASLTLLISELQDEIDDLKYDIYNLTKELDDLDYIQQGLIDQIGALEVLIESLGGVDLDELLGQIADLKYDLAAAELETAQIEIRLNQRINQLQTALDNKAGLQGQISALLARVEELEAIIDGQSSPATGRELSVIQNALIAEGFTAQIITASGYTMLVAERNNDWVIVIHYATNALAAQNINYWQGAVLTLRPQSDPNDINFTLEGRNLIFSYTYDDSGNGPINGYAVYTAVDAHIRGNRLIFSIFSGVAGDFDVVISGVGNYAVRVNDVQVIAEAATDANISLPLRRGNNLVELTGNVSAFDNITFDNKTVSAEVGASVAYVTRLFGVGSTTNGTIIGPSRQVNSSTGGASVALNNAIAGETVGRSAVRLQGQGQYVSWTLTQDANAFSVRASIPDNATGTGIDATIGLFAGNTRVGSVPLTSRHSWLYGTYGGDGAIEQWSNNPSYGNPRNFFNEGRLLLGQTFAAGTVMSLRIAAEDTAEWYVIDLVDYEMVDDAIGHTIGWTSIAAHGAVANSPASAAANLVALIAAITAARSTAANTVYIPAGVFYFPQMNYTVQGETITRGHNLWISSHYNGVTIRGAGKWHTEIRGGLTFTVSANDATFLDMAFVGNEVIRRNPAARALFENGYNENISGFTAHNIYISRYKVGFWFINGNNYVVMGNRVRDVFADGINLARGINNSTIANNSWRNLGDDAIAQWSQGMFNSHNVVRNNTIEVTWLANGIAVYGGGAGLVIENNIIQDTVHVGAGINISTDFNTNFNSEATISVRSNLLKRTGSVHWQSFDIGAIWINIAGNRNINPTAFTIEDNTILDSSFAALSISGTGNLSNTIFNDNMIDDAREIIYVDLGASGTIIARDNITSNITRANINNSSSFTIANTGNINLPGNGADIEEAIAALPAPMVGRLRLFVYNGFNVVEGTPRIHAWVGGTPMFYHVNMTQIADTNWYFADSTANIAASLEIAILHEDGDWSVVGHTGWTFAEGLPSRFFVLTEPDTFISDPYGFTSISSALAGIAAHGGGGSVELPPVADTATRIWFLNSGGWGQPFLHAWHYPSGGPVDLLGSWGSETQRMNRYQNTNWWWIDIPQNALLSPISMIIRSDANDSLRATLTVDHNRDNLYITWQGGNTAGLRHANKAAAGLL
ncbi:MAG: hypothetical protein FWC80_00190 [Firmicutes bacterium]|nr:hypothetical protein [Bacillota bacterium]